MEESHNIKTLGNQQLGLHYEVIYKKIDDTKIAILEDIRAVLGKTLDMDIETYKNPKKFHNHCKGYRSFVQETNKEIFLHFSEQERNIQEEIGKRQLEMLKEIGIIAPSVRVKIIMNGTKGEHFPVFDDLITYIKLFNEKRTDERPENKKIYIPQQLKDKFSKMRTTILTILAANIGPIAN